MRVLALVTDAFGGHGGIALYNRDVLNSLCEHDQVTEIIAIARCASSYSDAHSKKLIYDTNGIAGGFSFIKAIIKTLIRNREFKLILCCHINLMPLAWLLGKILKVPVILEIYGIEAWQPRGKWLAEFLSSSAHSVISISEYTRVRYLAWSRLNPNKCKILPNAIHADRYGLGEKSEELVKRYGVNNKKIILTLGRIVSKDRAKGFDEVLEVLPEIVMQHTGIVYIIAGEGEYSQTLKQKVIELGLEDYVVFTGMVDEYEKADLYRLADVYAMPSRGEGFGFVFLEAMACGIPVIASAVDGSREAVLDGELGAIVDPDQPAEIKTAILDALNLPKKIPKRLDYFSFKNFSRRLHKIVDEILI